MAVTALDPAARQNVIDTAKQWASQKGTTAQQELWNYAKQNNLSASDVDTYMGWDGGTTQNWVSSQPPAAPAAPTYNAEQQSIIKEAQRRAASNGTTAEQEAWNYAMGKGMSPGQVDNFFGWNPGTTDTWAKANVQGYANNGTGSAGSWPTATSTPTTPAGGGTPGTASTTPSVTTPQFNLANVQTAPQWTVDPKTQTVAGQLETVLSSSSPLLQRARTRALQAQNASGRLNSTMAEGAADAALYDTALQIATPDAATYSDAAKTNVVNSVNMARDANNYQYDLGKLATQNANNLGSIDRQAGYDLQKIDRQTAAARDVASVEAQYRSLTQGSASATSILNNMQASLDRLYANTDITDETVRTNMANAIRTNASNGLKLVGAIAGDTELAAYIDDLFSLE